MMISGVWISPQSGRLIPTHAYYTIGLRNKTHGSPRGNGIGSPVQGLCTRRYISPLILKRKETPTSRTLCSVLAAGLVLLQSLWPPVATTERYISRTNSHTRDSLRKGLYILLHNSFKQYIWTEVSTKLLNRDLKWLHHGSPSSIRWHWTVSQAGNPSYGTEFHSKTGVFKQGWSVEFREQGKRRWRS